MESAYQVIIRPVVSERSFDLMAQNKYTFEVDRRAAKREIADAVEKLFGVTVVRVNTINVKPKPNTSGKKGWVCKICGYVYEGDTLPEDFVCPLCKHGAADFEPIE